MDRRAGLIWLLDCFADVSDAELDDFASYGQGIGPEKASSEHLTGDTRQSTLRTVLKCDGPSLWGKRSGCH